MSYCMRGWIMKYSHSVASVLSPAPYDFGKEKRGSVSPCSNEFDRTRFCETETVRSWKLSAVNSHGRMAARIVQESKVTKLLNFAICPSSSIQTLQVSAGVDTQNVSFPAIKPHSAASHTIISDDSDSEPSLRPKTSQTEPCHHFVEVIRRAPFNGAAWQRAICSSVTFTRWLLDGMED
ncbi:hypothetical protein F2P81_001256 [Scophthalmus maximus]|uniref:Uncharacterized protein n=1 Tax=Scophthalmus maximus TaxID=52904 RepID=A0A6A4TN73_SCOMX|nr:hypothetical protein F2P81_001256 [Scophthalmus maximus]